MAAHQAPLSLGFSRQEHWSGLPFPSPMHERKSESEVAQSCPTLRDPMDCSTPGFPVHHHLPAAAAAAKSLQSGPTLWSHKWQPTRLPCPWDSPGKNTGVGCHFLLQCMKGKVKVKSFSHVRLLATPWTTAYQAPPSIGFSRQEYWSGVPLPSPGHVLENKIQQSFWNAGNTRENVWNTTYHNLSYIGPSLVVWNYM